MVFKGKAIAFEKIGKRRAMDLTAIGFVAQFGKHSPSQECLGSAEACSNVVNRMHGIPARSSSRNDGIFFCLHQSRTFFCLRTEAIRNGYTLFTRGTSSYASTPQVRCVKIELLQASNSRALSTTFALHRDRGYGSSLRNRKARCRLRYLRIRIRTLRSSLKMQAQHERPRA